MLPLVGHYYSNYNIQLNWAIKGQNCDLMSYMLCVLLKWNNLWETLCIIRLIHSRRQTKATLLILFHRTAESSHRTTLPFFTPRLSANHSPHYLDCVPQLLDVFFVSTAPDPPRRRPPDPKRHSNSTTPVSPWFFFSIPTACDDCYTAPERHLSVRRGASSPAGWPPVWFTLPGNSLDGWED